MRTTSSFCIIVFRRANKFGAILCNIMEWPCFPPINDADGYLRPNESNDKNYWCEYAYTHTQRKFYPRLKPPRLNLLVALRSAMWVNRGKQINGKIKVGWRFKAVQLEIKFSVIR